MVKLGKFQFDIHTNRNQKTVTFQHNLQRFQSADQFTINTFTQHLKSTFYTLAIMHDILSRRLCLESSLFLLN